MLPARDPKETSRKRPLRPAMLPHAMLQANRPSAMRIERTVQIRELAEGSTERTPQIGPCQYHQMLRRSFPKTGIRKCLSNWVDSLSSPITQLGQRHEHQRSITPRCS
tara:strand:- start:271 stop:594 length:324 start_codon:yes stop_codon:yes gene_type:complete